MKKIVLLCVVLAGCAQAPEPCPVGQARDNASACVAIAKPAEPNPFAQFGPPAPAKGEYIADQDAVAAFNRAQDEKRAAEDAAAEAKWDADRRADRIVAAQQETQRAVERVEDKLD